MQKLFTLPFKSCALCILISLMSCNLACSQVQKFIETVPSNTVPDNQEITAYIARLKKNPNISNYHFIHLNPLATAQKEGTLTLEIPGKDKPIIAEASEVKYHSATDYEWIGKTDDNRGTIIILSKEGRITAHFSTPDGVYEIFPAPGGLYCLQEIDMSEAGDVGCVITTENSSGGRISSKQADPAPPIHTNAKMNPCQPLVNPRVLVLYTPKALALAENVQTIIDQANLAVAQFNSTIYNSGITSNAVLTLAGVAMLNFVETSYKMLDDVAKLPNNVAAQNLRTQYQADLVVLFTDGEYGARGATASPFFNNSTAYSIVQILNAITNKTFAHEVGHIYGCRHDGEAGNPQYAQGHNIKNGLGIVVDRTLMSNNTADGSNRLLNFSNPNVSVSGKPTGTSANNNNALRVSETHLTIGNFKPNPPPVFVAYVDGPTFVTTQGVKSYELTYSCGSAPYSVVWHYSYDGVNYFSSNTTTDIFTWNFYQTQKIWIKGTVTGNGKSVSAFIAVTAQMPSPYKQVEDENKDSTNLENPNFRLSPNPGYDPIQFEYQLKSTSKVNLKIVDKEGRVIHVFLKNKSQPTGKYAHTWNPHNLSSGVYFVHLQIDNLVETKRLIIP